MSDSYEDYFQPRFTETTPSVAALQARIAELEAQLNPAVYAGRLEMYPDYLKRVRVVMDFRTMSLRYDLDDDLVQPWQHSKLHEDILTPMFAAIGLKPKYSAMLEHYTLEEI